MSASKYLPPFTSDERAGMATGHVGVRRPVEATMTDADAEATYADFLGEAVED